MLALLDQMSGLDHLAHWPAPGFVAAQQSSTDRRARSPAQADTWFANDDFVTSTAPNLVRIEATAEGNKRYVLLDAEGPGAVLRIWTATPTGVLRIHVDDEPRPVLEAEMRSLLAGEVPPFVPPFGQVTAMGHTLYFPFPYRKRCRITVDSIVSVDPFSGKPVDKLYYQIGYRTYRPGDAGRVRSYSSQELDRARSGIERVGHVLRDGIAAASPPGRTRVAIPPTTLEGQRRATVSVAAPPGGGQLTELRLFTGEREPGRLRSTLLTLSFDGEETVRAPLVDFFGSGPGWNPYLSLPMQIGADGWLVCRFPMPFRRRATVTISRAERGDGGGRSGPAAAGGVEIAGTVTVEPRPFGPESLLFHAVWRPGEVIRTRPLSDWHIATIRGRGQLVGTVLDVENPPGAAWWGEGDEKIYIDGEDFPGILGTGTEDYFGYAWSSGTLFAHAYHAQTRATGPGFSGQFSMNRFHVLDPIPFDHSLRFDLEAWHWSDTSMTLDATLYWYARPGGRDDFPRSR